MNRRSVGVSIVCGVGLLALTIAALDGSARAQSAYLVLCDRIAADPTDPDKPKDVKGVSQIAMLSKGAEVNSAEAQFQLGLMAAQRTGGPQDGRAGLVRKGRGARQSRSQGAAP